MKKKKPRQDTLLMRPFNDKKEKQRRAIKILRAMCYLGILFGIGIAIGYGLRLVLGW